MPITPKLSEKIANTFNLVPVPLVDFYAAAGFRAVLAGLRLGVLDALAKKPLSLQRLAETTHARITGLKQLLDAIAAYGYVKSTPDGYALSPMAKHWLPSLSAGADFASRMLFEDWLHLEERIRGTLTVASSYDDKARDWRAFQRGMIAMARGAAVEVAEKARLPRKARRLIDVGGGHGLYAVELCRRHRNLRATVFDLPMIQNIAAEFIAEEGMAERIEVVAGDFRSDSLGSNYDVALLFNILHAHSGDENVALLTRVAQALTTKGRILILDQIAEETERGGISGAIAALMSLQLFNASDGQAYPRGQITSWLESAGFAPCSVEAIHHAPGSVLITADRRR